MRYALLKMTPSRSEKQTVRDEIRERLRGLDPEERLADSVAVCKTILNSPVWAAADTVFAFVSLPDEVETTELCERALKEGKRLGLPRFGEEGLRFFAVENLAELRADNTLAIRQPGDGLPLLCSTREPRQPGRLLIVTPGRAFTREGERLGRGGGFYDTFFSALRENHIVFQAIGVAFEQQLEERLPVEENDERVHGVVTPSKHWGVV